MTEPSFRLNVTPEPTDEEAAAVAAALLILAANRASSATQPPRRRTSPWAMAGRRRALSASPAANHAWSDPDAWLKR